MKTLWQDIRYGLRMLARSPGFSLTVVALVAIGVGAATTVFGILGPILIRPLPYEKPDRIVCVQGRDREGDTGNVSYPDYLDWRRETTSFDELSCYAFRDRPVSTTAHEPPEECCVGFVSDSFFRVFPVRPVVGRFFSPADDRPSAAPVAVISHGLWRQHFGGDVNVIGRFIFVDDLGYSVIGVLPAAFRFFPYAAEESADVWVAMGRTMAGSSRPDRSRAVLGRLKVGRSVQEAQAEMDTVCARLAAAYPASNAGRSATVIRLHDFMRKLVGQAVGQGVSILIGTVLLVFLVACANAAGLMFARGVTREREMALRCALGGTRLKLMRLVLAENAILALLGGGLGVLGATWTIQLLMKTGLLPSERFPVGFFHPDWRVLGFTLALSLLTIPLCGLIPSFCCSGVSLARMLAAGGRSVLGSRAHNAAHTGLLAVQVALTIVLLVTAGLMTRSLLNVVTANRGFDPEDVLVMNLRLIGDQYAGKESQAAFHRQLLDQLGAIPGIAGAGLARPLLTGWNWYFHVEGEPVPRPDEEGTQATYKAVSPGYFETMGIRLLQGRFFDERDYLGSPPVVIVDETLANRYWPDGDAIGRRIQYASRPDPNSPWYEVVGVVGHVQNEIEADTRMQVYKVFFQDVSPRVSVVLRARSDPLSLVAAVKDVVARIDRRQLVWAARTLTEELWYRSLVRRFITSLLIAFSGIALLLSAVGIYAVTRYSVARRMQEFGIRMALGATRTDVLALVLRKGLTPVFIGAGIGLVGTVAVARVLSSLLYQLSPWDPLTYAAVSQLLAGVALLAGYLPARRAARIDPMAALRYE